MVILISILYLDIFLKCAIFNSVGKFYEQNKLQISTCSRESAPILTVLLLMLCAGPYFCKSLLPVIFILKSHYSERSFQSVGMITKQIKSLRFNGKFDVFVKYLDQAKGGYQFPGGWKSWWKTGGIIKNKRWRYNAYKNLPKFCSLK